MFFNQKYLYSFGVLFLVAVLSMPVIFTGALPIPASNAGDPTVPCREPLTYRIGSIDDRYEMSRLELKRILDDVQVLWESGMKRDLMNYRENGKVSVHLHYTERQQLTQEEKELSQNIERLNQQITDEKGNYRELSDLFNQQEKELKSMVSHYEEVGREYNNLVERLNQQGGIPPNKKREVQNFRRRLDMLESKINEKKEKVSSYRQRVNRKSDHINTLIDRQNELISRYNRQFAEAKKFNQGNYMRRGSQQQINIFQFSNRGELKAVLAHEFGHAFGIGHLQNPKAIMHAVMQQQNIYNLSLTQDDIRAMKTICGN